MMPVSPLLSRRIRKAGENDLLWNFIMKNKINPKLKIGLLVVLFISFIKFAVLPLHNWQTKAINDFNQLRQTVAMKKTTADSEQEINILFQETETELTNLQTYFFQNFSGIKGLQLLAQQEMEKIAAGTGVELDSTDWLMLSESDSLIEAPVKILCAITPQKLMEFMAAIENNEHMLTIDYLRIHPRNNSALVQAELHVSIYGLKKNG